MQITLKAARVNAGVSLERAAEEADITVRTLCNYENGTSVPNVNTAKKLAKCYGIGIDDIFFAESLRLKRNKIVIQHKKERTPTRRPI